MLLTREMAQEALSRAFVSAVAAKARYVSAHKDFDTDGIDITIEAGSQFRPKIDFQLKATQNLPMVNGNFAFPCPIKNYNSLIIPSQTPRALLVFRMPENEDEWLELCDEYTLLRHCAYWLNLKGGPPSSNHSSVTVYIPPENRLTVEALQMLMEHSGVGSLP